MLRSPYASATINSVDLSGAQSAPGVVAAYCGADLVDQWAGPMPCAWPVTDDMKNPTHYPLAVSRAAYAGDGVACVLATSDAAARDALELIDVDYTPHEAVIDLEDALSDRVVIHPTSAPTRATRGTSRSRRPRARSTPPSPPPRSPPRSASSSSG